MRVGLGGIHLSNGLSIGRGVSVGGGGGGGVIEYVNDSPSAIMPTLGPELLTNADLSAWADDNPDGFTVASESGSDPEITERDSGQLHADTKTVGGAANFYASTNSNNLRMQQSVMTPQHWYQFEAVVSAYGVTTAGFRLCDGTVFLSQHYSGTGTKQLRGRVTSAVAQYRAGAGGIDVTVDGVSCRELLNIMATERTNVPIGSWGYTHWAIAPDRHAGAYLKYDDDNYIYWYADRNRNGVYLVKCVLGTINEVANAAFTYDANKAIWWRHDEVNRWQIGYDTPADIEAYTEADWTTNALIDVDTIVDANLTMAGNVYEFGALSTDEANTPHYFYYRNLPGVGWRPAPLPDPNSFVAANAETYLVTPTYDGSNQIVHPDVVVFDAPWNGYRYWMAMTPYPFQNAAYENPSILASEEGDTWVVPDGLTNPIEPRPDVGINSDTDLVYNQADGKLYCIWRYTDSATVDVIRYRSSSDGVNWSSAVDMLTDEFPDLRSPAVLWDGQQWVMYVMGNGVIRRFMAASLAGPWTEGSNVVLNSKPSALGLWHHDCILADGIYYLLLAESRDDIYLAVSDDGVTFHCAPTPLLTNGTGTGKWDNQGLYRSTLVKTASGLDIWYSGMGDDNAWHVGRTTAVQV